MRFAKSGSRPVPRQLIPGRVPCSGSRWAEGHAHIEFWTPIHFSKPRLLVCSQRSHREACSQSVRSSPAGAPSQASSANRLPRRTRFCRASQTRACRGLLGLDFLLGVMLSLLLILCSLDSAFRFVRAFLLPSLLPPNLLSLKSPA